MSLAWTCLLADLPYFVPKSDHNTAQCTSTKQNIVTTVPNALSIRALLR